jgi:hypothetical protein
MGIAAGLLLAGALANGLGIRDLVRPKATADALAPSGAVADS